MVYDGRTQKPSLSVDRRNWRKGILGTLHLQSPPRISIHDEQSARLAFDGVCGSNSTKLQPGQSYAHLPPLEPRALAESSAQL
eukprot:1082357-Pleurochrysis_carterae.AAC.1